MALSILDGNQTATTLSSVLSSGEHIPAHTVVSLGTQAITDIRNVLRGTTGESTVTTVTATSSFTLKAANTSRKLLSIYNEGAGTLNILYGSGTVTTANYSIKVFRGYYLSVDKYTGQVNGLFESAGTARVTEIT